MEKVELEEYFIYSLYSIPLIDLEGLVSLIEME